MQHIKNAWIQGAGEKICGISNVCKSCVEAGAAGEGKIQIHEEVGKAV